MIRTLLLPLDGSQFSDQILAPILRILKAQDGGVVSLLQVVSEEDCARASEAIQEATDHLSRIRTDLSAKHVPSRLDVVVGDPSGEILRSVDSLKPDLVAMATSASSGVHRWLRESVAQRVLHHCPTSLLLWNPAALAASPPTFRRLLVPLDGSPESLGILPLVIEIASIFESEVLLFRSTHLTHRVGERVEVWAEGEVAETLEPARTRLEDAGIQARVLTAYGDAEARIVEAIEREDVDLLVFSTHPRADHYRWRYGAVATSVLEQCRCPMLLHRL